MAGLRVFLVGATTADLEALAAHAARVAGLEVVGRALASAIDSGAVVIPAAVDAVLSRPRRDPGSDDPPRRRRVELFEPLTPRERAVLALVADGLPNREIARALEISEHTVKFHLSSIFGKLGAASRTEAVRRGFELGLIEI
jgi:DNA-binding NarL/FixJ family response regulator